MTGFDKKKFMAELNNAANVEKIKKEFSDVLKVDYKVFSAPDVRQAVDAAMKELKEAVVELVVGVDLAAKASGVTDGADKSQIVVDFIFNECIKWPKILIIIGVRRLVKKYLAKWVKLVLSYTVGTLNAKVGKAWDKDTPAKANGDAPEVAPAG